MSTPALRKLCELPLGSWFRYVGADRSYILIDRGDAGLVAEAPTAERQGASWVGQGIYSAAETSAEFRELLVFTVVVGELVSAKSADDPWELLQELLHHSYPPYGPETDDLKRRHEKATENAIAAYTRAKGRGP